MGGVLGGVDVGVHSCAVCYNVLQYVAVCWQCVAV